MIGNSVVVSVIRRIAKKLKKVVEYMYGRLIESKVLNIKSVGFR